MKQVSLNEHKLTEIGSHQSHLRQCKIAWALQLPHYSILRHIHIRVDIGPDSAAEHNNQRCKLNTLSNDDNSK